MSALSRCPNEACVTGACSSLPKLELIRSPQRPTYREGRARP
jgi:hypothetical protein